jgi:hypothetical protein
VLLERHQMKNTPKLNILILCPLGYVGSIAFVMESIESFANRGHRVVVLVNDAVNPSFKIQNKNVTVVTCSNRYGFKGAQIISLFKEAFHRSRTGLFDLAIGLSPMGLIIIALIRRIYYGPYIFFNDEICFGNERDSLVGKLYGFFLKKIEIWANQNALFSVTQDPERGRFVSETNHIPVESLYYLPNSRTGRAKISDSMYLHDLFGFSYDIRIILWLGAARPTDGALELAEEAISWPPNFRLVFHFRTDQLSQYMSKIVEYHGKGQVFISDKPTLYRDLSQLVGSATIGLGLYEDQGINTRHIGASSGKINAFLKLGIPCIVSSYEGMKWIEDGGAGLCISHPTQVLNAAKKILKDFQNYQANAVSLFENRLNFDKAFDPIVRMIENKIDKTNMR